MKKLIAIYTLFLIVPTISFAQEVCSQELISSCRIDFYEGNTNVYVYGEGLNDARAKMAIVSKCYKMQDKHAEKRCLYEVRNKKVTCNKV